MSKVISRKFTKIRNVIKSLLVCFSDVNLGFVIVAKEDCGPEILSSEGGDRQDMYKKLEEGLLGQIKMCETNQNYFKVTGDVPSSNKFQQVRKFEYEQKLVNKRR